MSTDREWICLLRGINLGARNKVNMPELRRRLGDAGFTDVRSYVQSGNVVLTAPHRDAGEVGAAVRAVVLEGFGIDTPVVVRTPERIRELVAWCPYPADAAERPTAVHVIHLAERPEPARLKELLAADWGDDEITAEGTELCLRYSATMHRSRLQHAMLLKRLGVDGTARNWRTLTAIADLLTPRGS